ncbi:uncharacterized protein LOC132060641 [Lycium ferocissimum]|uniref:uncharacterized protein LOC132060641 n=1 Tax=Lycium ferocissimum TaxID=112874 RepID=UPI002815654F|nr:uncharacterized protein LOC132060641 [Lycium ferocissimum]
MGVLRYFQKDVENSNDIEDLHMKDVDPINSSVVYCLEVDMTGFATLMNVSRDDPEALKGDFPSEVEWDVLNEMEQSEEVNRLETDEIEERMEKDVGGWDVIYRNARKAENLQFETNERDEGELERTGQAVCIYEVYDETGAWPFLHHGSLYSGLSLVSSCGLFYIFQFHMVSSRFLLYLGAEMEFLRIQCYMLYIFANADQVHSLKF